MIARAITARCFWPPERSDGYLSMNCSAGARPDALERRRPPAARTRRDLREPWISQRMADRLLDRHRRVQRGVRVLEDDLHAPAERAELALAQTA